MLPFLFAGAIQLAHCDACSMQISQGAARSPVISREQRELARSTLRPALRLIPVLNMHKLYWPSEKQNGSVHAPENRMSITTNSEILRLFHLQQYFNGKKIRRILKLYGLFVHNMIFFFSKRVFAAIFSDMSSPKFLTAKNRLPVRLNCF